MDRKKILKDLFQQSLEQCSAENAVAACISADKEFFKIKGHGFRYDKPLYVLGAGKASAAMFNSARDKLGGKISHSLVITSDLKQAESCGAENVITAAHPVPDESSLRAGQAALDFVKDVPADALLLFLISGGTSSLMCMPAEGIPVDDLHQTFQLLNNCGASIHEMNTVRKHCSRIKGGGILRYIKEEVTLIDLILSDIPDDDLSMIGSGPTIPDPTTFRDTCTILQKYGIAEKIPFSVQKHIEQGLKGEVRETLKKGESSLKEHYSYIISSARRLAEEIAKRAEEAGFESCVAAEAYHDDVEEVASFIAQKVLSAPVTGKKRLFVFYGESMVKVNGDGRGGRNQELALRGAVKIAGRGPVYWLSAGTDGIDGPTDAAGALVDGDTISHAREKGLDPEEFLEHNNSYPFHEKMGTLFKTGATGNNLMDIVLVLKG